MTKLVRLLSFFAFWLALATLAVHYEPGFNHCQEQPLHEPNIDDSSLTALFSGALSKGEIMWPLILALLAGFLTSLSPCVYPLIPITLSIMGARTYESHLHGFLVALSYVLGMSVVYTFLGALFASLGIVAGSLMQSTAVLIIVALILLLMALALLGVFDLSLPSWAINRLSRIGGRGFKGAFLMGLVAGVIAAPCTGPTLGAILALIAHDRNFILGVLLMSSFSLGLGLPFLVLGTFSSALAHVPKSGAWMNPIKYLLGSITLGACFYFLAQALRPFHEILVKLASFNNILVFIVTALGIIILGFLSEGNLGRIVGSLLCSLGFVVLFNTHISAPEPSSVALKSPLSWHIIDSQTTDYKFLDVFLTQAKQNCQPVLIDFYADWCIACREFSAITFVDPAVKTALSRFLLIKVDASHNSKFIDAIHKRFNVTGLPTIIFLSRDGQEIAGSRIMGFLKPKPFLKALGSY